MNYEIHPSRLKFHKLLDLSIDLQFDRISIQKAFSDIVKIYEEKQDIPFPDVENEIRKTYLKMMHYE